MQTGEAMTAETTTSGIALVVAPALIGAASALVTMIVKDGLLDWLKERRQHRRSDAEVYGRYLGPLADACEKLVWRSHEIFVDRRHSFLDTAAPPLEFNAYKRTSTLYRIATLIGWIRSMNLELNALAAHNPGYSPPIAKQIAAFRSALADGPSVEVDRLRQVCRIWSFDLSGLDDAAISNLAMRFEVRAHAIMGGEAGDLKAASRLSHDGRFRACRALADFIAGILGKDPPQDDAVKDTLDEAILSLSYREALIYREWQDAIGDAMIARDADSPRRFRIIGYEAFSDLIAEGGKPWFRVFGGSLDDIDLSEPDPRDFRSHQLRKTAQAAATMLIAIKDTSRSSPVTAAALATARAVKGLEASQASRR